MTRADVEIKAGAEIERDGQWYFVLTVEDYDRLLIAAEADEMLLWCETCGAWIDRDDEAAAHIEDFDGCWRAATGGAKDNALCRSYRVSEIRQRIRERDRMQRTLDSERADAANQENGK